MRSSWLIAVLYTLLVRSNAQVAAVELHSQASADGPSSDIQSLTIYDSVSRSMPFELRERGIATYAAANRSGYFSESGIHSRPHESASDVYRIGTEDFLALWTRPATPISTDASVDETLTLHLDMNGDLYHCSYSMKQAVSEPGAFTIKVHHSADHIGPGVSLKQRATKETENDGATLTDEEDVPEKTFLQKYWIYAVPLVLLLVLSAGGEQQ